MAPSVRRFGGMVFGWIVCHTRIPHILSTNVGVATPLPVGIVGNHCDPIFVLSQQQQHHKHRDFLPSDGFASATTTTTLLRQQAPVLCRMNERIGTLSLSLSLSPRTNPSLPDVIPKSVTAWGQLVVGIPKAFSLLPAGGRRSSGVSVLRSLPGRILPIEPTREHSPTRQIRTVDDPQHQRGRPRKQAATTMPFTDAMHNFLKIGTNLEALEGNEEFVVVELLLVF